MTTTQKATLTPEEARQLHHAALVIDTQQPPATYGFLFTDNMREALASYHAQGLSQQEASELLAAMAAREIQTSADARRQYLDFWAASGVDVASGTYAGAGPIQHAFERAVRNVAQARAIVDALRDDMLLVLDGDDIERAHTEGKYGLIIDFQDTIPFENDLNRIEVFYNLGLRVVQLTYNLRNLVGDGCTEASPSGLTYFGREVVQRLNELNMVVDVSHCAEQVAWDTLEVSTAPVMITHASSAAICDHDRAKSDKLAKAVADKGGFFGVVVIPGFIQDSFEATLDDFADQVEHLVNVMGIDHVGIGTDKAGPGPGTDSMVEYPPGMPKRPPGSFNYSGFRDEEHRITDDYRLVGYEKFSDWPNLTVKLAERGFNEQELRQLLGLNYLRVFREIVG
jgi:membrane dipeptidase